MSAATATTPRHLHTHELKGGDQIAEGTVLDTHPGFRGQDVILLAECGEVRVPAGSLVAVFN